MTSLQASDPPLYAVPESLKVNLIRWRRHLHRYPELSFEEHRTAQFVEDTLFSFGSLVISRPTQTSVMARLIGGKPGKIVALRADMDALPIMEENEFPFTSSSPGVMHACGHDGHTAIMLGAACMLSALKQDLCGEVRFLFQHAEEMPPGGAEQMVLAGVMDGVDAIVGAHLSVALQTGSIGIVYGPAMASPDTFRIAVLGKGGHAAYPQETVDAIAIGAQLVSNLQHIVSRQIDPMESVVVSVTKFIGGTATNVIPGTLEIEGTVRCFKPELREAIPALMERIVQGITMAHGASYEWHYERGCRSVINDISITKAVESAAHDIVGSSAVVRLQPDMGGDDFSAFTERAPGTYFYIGSGHSGKGITYPHHHPKFTLDEDSLEIGVALFVQTALRLLNDASR